MTIHIISQADPLWLPVADFAEQCSWDACARMAKLMRDNEFTDWERLFTATEGDKILGFCALVKPKGFPGTEYSPLVKWIFVDEKYRGNRLSEKLLKSTSEYVSKLGTEKVYLTTWHIGLYEKYGFVKICDKEVRDGYSEGIFERTTAASL